MKFLSILKGKFKNKGCILQQNLHVYIQETIRTWTWTGTMSTHFTIKYNWIIETFLPRKENRLWYCKCFPWRRVLISSFSSLGRSAVMNTWRLLGKGIWMLNMKCGLHTSHQLLFQGFKCVESGKSCNCSQTDLLWSPPLVLRLTFFLLLDGVYSLTFQGFLFLTICLVYFFQVLEFLHYK